MPQDEVNRMLEEQRRAYEEKIKKMKENAGRPSVPVATAREALR